MEPQAINKSHEKFLDQNVYNKIKTVDTHSLKFTINQLVPILKFRFPQGL